MVVKIAVIGGGLGGLAFAQSMRNVPGYKVTVYERDAGYHMRNQGYQIGLNAEGIASLRDMDLPWLNNLLNENPRAAILVNDSKLEPLMKIPMNNTKDNIVSSLVNRWKLRDFLATGLDIQWNRRFVSYEEREDGVYIQFEDGSLEIADIMVGADGVNSRIRAQYRPDLEVIESGCSSIIGYFPLKLDVNNELSLMKKYIQEKACLGRAVLNSTHSLLFMKFIDTEGEVNMLWYMSYQTVIAAEKFGEFSTDPTEVKKQLAARGLAADCSPEILKMFELTPEANIEQPKVGLMMRHKESPHERPNSLPPTMKRIVLLGDAAHAMTTNAGRGANTAFQDCIMLRDELNKVNPNEFAAQWPAAHDNYERAMFTNGFAAMADSFNNTQRIHKEDNTLMLNYLWWMGQGTKIVNFITTGDYSIL